MARGNAFVISGPSGAGKGTILARVLEEIPNAWFSVSATTRKPRAGEVEGESYFFLTDAQFDDLVEHDGFLEWAAYSENRYGTPRAAVEEKLDAGCRVFFDIDVQGAFQIREKMPEARLVFVQPPSLDVLEQRLRGRGTETDAEISRRLDAASREMELAKEYDYRLVNDDLDCAVQDLVEYVRSAAPVN